MKEGVFDGGGQKVQAHTTGFFNQGQRSLGKKTIS